MKESRNPDAVRGWLNSRVDEGFDENSIKAMLRMSSEQLAEVILFFFFFYSVFKTLLDYS
jgi:hypothetical protein